MSRVPNRYVWHKEPPSPARSDGVWSISYADLMTLLLCFFVVILMISPPPAPRADKVQSVMASLRSAFGVTREGGRPAVARQGTLLEQLVAITENADNGSSAPPRAGTVSVRHEPDGLHITLWGETVSAGAASAPPALTAGTANVLRRMAPALRELNPRIEVRAYSDVPPVSGNTSADAVERHAAGGLDGAFGCARAAADVLAQCGLPIDRLQLQTAPDARPTGAGQSLSHGDTRRVEVIVQARGGSLEVPASGSGVSPAE